MSRKTASFLAAIVIFAASPDVSADEQGLVELLLTDSETGLDLAMTNLSDEPLKIFRNWSYGGEGTTNVVTLYVQDETGRDKKTCSDGIFVPYQDQLFALAVGEATSLAVRHHYISRCYKARSNAVLVYAVFQNNWESVVSRDGTWIESPDLFTGPVLSNTVNLKLH